MAAHQNQSRGNPKYNNKPRTGQQQLQQQQKTGGQNQNQGNSPQLSQRELCNFLTEKLLQNKFVEVKTKEIQNDRGTLYEIDIKNHALYRIGNSTFYSMKLHTVSHKSRVIFIRIIFNDNESRNADMYVNSDAIIQIFREIAPNTIDSITIENVNDSKGEKHLAVIASTVKGASLNYTYERALQFVHVVDEKYGSSADAETSSSNKSANVSQGMSTDEIAAEEILLEKKLAALQKIKQLRLSKNTNTSQSTSSSYASAAGSSAALVQASAAGSSAALAQASAAAAAPAPEPATPAAGTSDSATDTTLEEITANGNASISETPRSRPTTPSKISITVSGKTKIVNRK